MLGDGENADEEFFYLNHLGGISMMGQTFYGLKFKGTSFNRLDASGLSLSNCNFTDCDLSEADFKDSSLEIIYFENCDLTKADLSSIQSASLIFTNCDIEGLRLINSQLENSCFNGCKGSIEMVAGCFEQCYFINCDLEDSDLDGAGFEKVYFSGCNLENLHITDGTVFEGVELSDKCSITNTHFIRGEGGCDIIYNDTIFHPYSNKQEEDDDDEYEYENNYGLTILSNARKYGPAPIIRDLQAYLYCSDLDEFESVL